METHLELTRNEFGYRNYENEQGVCVVPMKANLNFAYASMVWQCIVVVSCVVIFAFDT